MYNKIIHSLIKDEDHILNEWILHNILNIEFDHIYIYDDQSEILIEKTIDILPPEIKSKVTVFTLEKNINFYDKVEFEKSIFYNEEIYNQNINNKQFYFQNYFLYNYRLESKWCLFCDVDEFIYLKNNNKLDEILEKYNDNDIIYIPWLIYGSSFYIDQPEGLIIDNFKYHDINYHNLGKSICKLSNITVIDHSHTITIGKTNFNFNTNEKIYSLPIHINHYQINSIKLYIKRKLRSEIGYTDGSLRKPNDIFLFMQAYNLVYSNYMDKYIGNINKILNKNLSYIPVNLNYKYSSNGLYIDNKIYYKVTSQNDLNKILNSSDIKFLKFEDELPKDFNIDNYKNLNKDLLTMTDVQLLNHYILFGKNENRKYSNDKKEDIESFSISKAKSIKSEPSKSISSEESSIESTTSCNSSVSSINKNDSNSDDSTSDIDINEDDEINNSLLPLDFDVLEYKKLNSDLNNLSNINAIYHYINYGIKEKRKYKINSLPIDFDPVIYKKLNKDLKHLSDDKATEHFLSNGINEKRKYVKNNLSKEKGDLPPDDFDPEVYKILNKDLSHLSNLDATNHYLINGCSEKREYKKSDNIKISVDIPEDFNPIIYKKLNKDLSHLSNLDAINHYLVNGFSEKRIYKKIEISDKDKINLLPDDFDPEIYKKLNKDLKDLSNEKASEHYLKIGINEKRKYKKNIKKEENSEEDIKVLLKNKLPPDFDPIIYKSLNIDLQNLSDNSAMYHYINNGKNENRKYKTSYTLPDDFDPIIYKKINKDLQNLSDTEAINHYLLNGIDEKRKYKKYKSI